MSTTVHRDGLFPALLRHWRHRRGISQLDLALAAGVSARHVGFLETGRSAPSAAMVETLARPLGVPLRDVDELLRAAGHAPVHAGPDDLADLPGDVSRAVDELLGCHDPFPAVVLDRLMVVQRANRGARAVLAPVLAAAGVDELDGLGLGQALLDERVGPVAVENFDDVARTLLRRVTRDALGAPEDGALQRLAAELRAAPTAPEGWRGGALSEPASPSVELRLRTGGEPLRFLMVATVLQAPQRVLLDELLIETWLPLDDHTRAACRAAVG